MEAKYHRHQRLLETRQALVLAAARRVLVRKGLDGLSMREIAHEAGYTPGALYAHFRNKQDVVAGLLDEALARAHQAVQALRPAAALPDQALVLQGEAWMQFWLQHPHDLDLLLHGCSRRGTQAWPVERVAQVQTQLRLGLQPLARALASLGLDAATLQSEVDGMLAQGLGLLLAWQANAATPAATPDAQFAQYLRRVWADRDPSSGSRAPQASAQVDLFG